MEMSAKCNRREFIRFAAIGAAGLAATSCAPATVPPGPTAGPTAEVPATPTPAGPILTDKPAGPGERPVQQVVYATPAEYEAATGQKIAAYNESPVLAELVKQGKLPPVAERLPEEPVVVKPEETIGKYGGALVLPIEGQERPSSVLMGYFNLDPLTTISPTGAIIPNVAKAWEISEDGKVITLYLRKGLKWSDGQPYTADDILFWWEDMVLNDELTPSKPAIMKRKGELAQVKKVDDYTVQFVFAAPYGIFPTYLASWGGPRTGPNTSPKHYLSQFHPKYAAKEDIEKMMKEQNFENWVDLFGFMNSGNNPDKPSLSPWLPNERPPQAIQTYRCNPYYFKVDTAGNQLPYICEVRTVRLADTEAILLKFLAGELDMASLGFLGGSANLPLLEENAEKVGYRFTYGRWMPNSLCNIMFNFNSPDPVKRQLYNDVRFRRALSVAINREELIKLVWKGNVFPSQVAPAYGPPYHGESDLFKQWTQYDPDLANKLLDELGLTKRDAEGYRLGPNGEELLFVIYATTSWPVETPEVMELVRAQWKEVGIKAVVKPEAGQLWTARHNAGEHDMSARGAHFGGGPVPPTLNENTFALSGWEWAPEWALWLDTNGAQGVEPPEDVKRIRALREEIEGEADEAKRVELTMEVLKIHMDNLWSIGLVVDDTRFNSIWVKNRVRNVPTQFASSDYYPNVSASFFINE
jgi:peptide/nickel transport system substrate-binding protein